MTLRQAQGDRPCLRPAADRRVRKPDGALLPDAGELVAMTAYWARRIADGDVESADEDVEQVEKKSK